MNDTHLIDQIRQGDQKALSRLYDRYARIVYSLALAIVRDKRDAEEVVQEVFLQIWRRASKYDRDRASVYKWLTWMTRSRAIDKTRTKNFHQHRRMEFELDPESNHQAEPATQLDAVLILERSARIRELFEQLPVKQKQVLELAFFRGLTHTEIAEKLTLPLGTIKTRIRQGMIKLQQRFTEEWKP